ncbi:hypothetical protein CONCODRAFT_69725 [Conidiobolus coronatus NRRL 28638]|uniref:DUF7137 domain-containing protein n=1 Tax=Conidiobolus coronatus (strain ATCC 28846 / CBS 209.66 / NRRL 28638) TaxID=796925 RepID=A0A137P992_CONC2|nr:hypothetical protein CONCODRAFT_69725 [Conidiobolus coronatus NRRL 28638]|eukprot:KXN71559.1 hypothetical protein CONCODRAFT_69725 [Conidiobolus coronatus NRRL 28638]
MLLLFQYIFYIILACAASDKNSTDTKNSTTPKDKTPMAINSPGALEIISPLRTQVAPALVALDSKLKIEWKYQVKPTVPVSGWDIIALRETPRKIFYYIARNQSASDLKYEWDIQAFNDDPENIDKIVVDGNYKLYIFDSNHTYDYGAKYGELLPSMVQFAVYKSQVPTKNVLSSGFKFSCSSALVTSLLMIFYSII